MTDFYIPPGRNVLQELVAKIEPRHTAVVILDMQKGIWPPPPRTSTPDSERIVPAVNRLIAGARAANTPVIWVRSTYGDWFDLDNWRDRYARLYTPPGRYTVEGTPGTDFLDGLVPERDDFVLTKHYYSPFAYSPFDLILRCRGINTLILTGGGLLGAVESAAKEAFVRGYYIVVASDCVYPVEGSIYDTGLDYIAQRLGDVATSDEILQHWGAPTAGARG